MVKKITVESYDGAFGMEYVHWNEKLEATKEKVIYSKRYYHKVPVDFSNISGYSEVISNWSYKPNDNRLFNNQLMPIDLFENIYDEIKKLITDQIIIQGCDMDGVDIIIELENGEKIKYHVDGKLTNIEKIYETNIVKLFKQLIPNGEKKPLFI